MNHVSLLPLVLDPDLNLNLNQVLNKVLSFSSVSTFSRCCHEAAIFM